LLFLVIFFFLFFLRTSCNFLLLKAFFFFAFESIFYELDGGLARLANDEIGIL